MFRWIFAIYLRLSSDDKEKNESNSITNQKSIIMKFLKQFKDIKVFKIYIDDGYTGTDFDRPGFQEMMEDIQAGKVNGIIVKDLSRLGRDYIGIGDFIEKIIPKYNLRFISINDNVDSYINPRSLSSLEVSFKSLMNDSYAKDTSNKMRSSLKASKGEGNFVGKYAPFGYIKDKNNCHKLNIDKNASKIIKDIFDMVINGKTRQQIVNYLNFNHILTPSMYFKNILNYKVCRVSSKWNLKMLDSIIKNEIYTGNLIQGRYERINHKTHNLVRCAEEDWIKVENTHEPIISKLIFKQANSILYGRNCKVNNNGQYYKFTGYLKCVDCGCNMNRNSRTKKGQKKVFYYCSTYRRTKNCSKHYISENEIEEVLIDLINNQIAAATNLISIIDNKLSFSSIEYNNQTNKIKIVELEKEIEKYEMLMNEVINDFKNNYISKEDFDYYNKNYLFELNNLKIEKEKLEKNGNSELDLNWLYKLKKTEKINKINKNIVDEFIEDIFVHENRYIEVIFKYSNQYDNLIKYLRSKENMV